MIDNILLLMLFVGFIGFAGCIVALIGMLIVIFSDDPEIEIIAKSEENHDADF